MTELSRREALAAATFAGAVAALPAWARQATAPAGAQWDLSELYPSDAAWEDARKRMLAAIPAIAKFKGRLGESADVLAEALTLTALLGSTLKQAEGQMTLQAQTQGGIVSLLVCDYKNGELRGYVQYDALRLSQLGKQPSLFALFHKGHLAITFDQATTKERYQGIVPLDGGSLAEAAQSYFLQSEQIPSLVRLGAPAASARYSRKRENHMTIVLAAMPKTISAAITTM